MADTTTSPHTPRAIQGTWTPLPRSLYFLVTHFRILFLSLVLFFITWAVTWLFYQVSMHFVNQYIGSHFAQLPAADTAWGWIKHQVWLLSKWIFIIVSNIISFYFAFLFSYCLTTPGYCFLSSSVEKIHSGKSYEEDSFSLHGLAIDLTEGLKIGLLGMGVTVVALLLNFLPAIGQLAVFLLYSYYSCLMFIDYPASKRRWSLGKKIFWLKKYPLISLRLGFLPALISLIPLVNVFLMALIFPVLTVHSTLNFATLEGHYSHNQGHFPQRHST